MQDHDNLNLLKFDLPDNRFLNEKTFTTWFHKEIKIRGWFAFKISDMDIREKPSDSIFAYKWMSGLIEFKFTKHSSTVPFSHLRWSSPSKPWGQVLWLKLFAANTVKRYWKSLVCIYSQKEHCYRIFDIRNEEVLYNKIDFKWNQGS